MPRKKQTIENTIVGGIDSEILSFTVGEDPCMDARLVEWDALGTAAHAVMLSRIKQEPPVLPADCCRQIISCLVGTMRESRQREFVISERDQDVHMAVERRLTERLGEAGRRVHAGRSRNDQVALDLRLYGRERIDDMGLAALALAAELLRLAGKHEMTPMVGRTHLQPAMPSSVGLWASGYAEALLDDLPLLDAAYRFTDRCPLGSAAGYGVSLPVDRLFTARLLGFSAPIHNVFCAGLERGKAESITLAAACRLMITCSRLAEDLIIFTMPEFGYFTLPRQFCTGSSIMPQKNNPDVLELVRARAARVMAHEVAANAILKGLAGGYNRDLQEIKPPFMTGVETTTGSLLVLARLVSGTRVDPERLRAGFSPGVFATDRALDQVAAGVPFRDAYRRVRAALDGLDMDDPDQAVARKTHLGATAGLDLAMLRSRLSGERRRINSRRRRIYALYSRLLGVKYPQLPT